MLLRLTIITFSFPSSFLSFLLHPLLSRTTLPIPGYLTSDSSPYPPQVAISKKHEAEDEFMALTYAYPADDPAYTYADMNKLMETGHLPSQSIHSHYPPPPLLF